MKRFGLPSLYHPVRLTPGPEHPCCRSVRQASLRATLLAGLALGIGLQLAAQAPDTLPQRNGLKQLSLEQLMAIEVTSVSKRPERLSETASAIQVITAEEIRRSGVTTLPEALRLATNLQVAQVNASQWAISARGFNNVLANKLLVLIDGRTVYTPLYAGVFWDVQNPPLETIERIEVISGPGGALWGANAVNGVINIITKKATDTAGLGVEAAAGTQSHAFGTLRYGAALSPKWHGRIYLEDMRLGPTDLADTAEAHDAWHMFQTGLRVDGDASDRDQLTLSSDLYRGKPDPDGGHPIVAEGANGLARWSHTMSELASFQLQFYYDRTYRDFKNGFTEDLATYDADWQHRFQLGHRQGIIWGLSLRLMNHHTQNLDLFGFHPGEKLLHLYSGFVQDEVGLVPDRLRLTLGARVEHNDFTGWEYQPSVRLAWTPNEHQTVWSAVSRAVRTPARIDRDFEIDLAAGVPLIMGGPMVSEEVLAYELGWRAEPDARSILSLSAFYNQYDNIRSAEPGPPPLGIPITFANGVAGHTYGAEVTAAWQASERWRLRLGYTYLIKRLRIKPGSADLNNATAESDDPKHQFSIQSFVNVTRQLQGDLVLRYVDALPDPAIPSYFGLDVRLGWHLNRHLELSVTGQNLLQSRHLEFMAGTTPARSIERAAYLKLSWD